MTKEELGQIVTKNDLLEMEGSLIIQIKKIVSEKDRKKFYTPKEFERETGMKYSTIIYYCSSGKLKARQDGKRGSWTIEGSELDRYIDEANLNALYND